MTRRYHPLEGRQLDVIGHLKQHVIVRLPDRTRFKIPRTWTDVDGSRPPYDATQETIFTLESLRELITLIDALKRRS